MNREEIIYPEDNHETFGFEHLRTPTWDFKTCLGKSLVFLSKQKNKIKPSEYLCNYILKHLSVIATKKFRLNGSMPRCQLLFWVMGSQVLSTLLKHNQFNYYINTVIHTWCKEESMSWNKSYDEANSAPVVKK